MTITERLFNGGFETDEYSEPDDMFSSGNETDGSVGNEGDYKICMDGVDCD